MHTEKVVQFHEMIHKMLPIVLAVLNPPTAVLVKAGRKEEIVLITNRPVASLQIGLWHTNPHVWIFLLPATLPAT